MTQDEARKTVEIMLTADGGCGDCAYRLIVQFVRAWPEHLTIVNKVWESDFAPTDWEEET
jgi:hypothetical protein